MSQGTKEREPHGMYYIATYFFFTINAVWGDRLSWCKIHLWTS